MADNVLAGQPALANCAVLLSHASEDSPAVEKVASILRRWGLSVYDAAESALPEASSNTYNTLAIKYRRILVVLFISRHYLDAARSAPGDWHLTQAVRTRPETSQLLAVNLGIAPDATHFSLWRTIEYDCDYNVSSIIFDLLVRFYYGADAPLEILPDIELMKLVASQRNHQAFAILYERYYPYVRRIALRFGDDDAQRVDAACQCVMQRFWERMDELYLLESRHEQRRWIEDVTQYFLQEATVYPIALDQHLPLSAGAASHSGLERIKEACMHLKEPEQKYVLLRYAQRETTDQIAIELGLPENAVNALHHKVLSVFRDSLGSDFGEAHVGSRRP